MAGNSTLPKESSIDQKDSQTKSDISRPKNRTSTGKRKYHSKSRNGCSTCKRRRVKCDEVRPICSKCQHLKLECGYLHEDNNKQSSDDSKQTKKRKVEVKSESVSTQQATPSLTPSPGNIKVQPTQIVAPAPPLVQEQAPLQVEQQPGQPQPGQSEPVQPQQAVPPPNSTFNALASGLLRAGNLNNINIARLVNDLSGMTDLSALNNLGNLGNLGNLANLSSLATLAQFPIDLSNLGSLIDSGGLAAGMAAAATAAAAARIVPETTNVAASSSERTSTGSIASTTSTQSNVHSATPITPNTSSSIFGEIESEQHQQQLGYTNFLKNSNNINDIPNGHSSENESSTSPTIPQSNLNMLDLRLMFHYTSQVASTITGAGISDTNIWNFDIPMLAFDYPFLMHSLLAFSATHLSRTEKGLDQCVTCHRGNALRLLREAVLNINPDNTDALVASALILIMDSLANASFPSSTSPISLPASAWIFHVKGAATILTAVWPLTEASRFYKFISVDLGDLGDIINQRVNLGKKAGTTKNGNGPDGEQTRYYTDLECHDSDIADLYPVEIDSPYLITLAYLNKLHKERYKSDFILRIFAFPALLDKVFLTLLMSGDVKAMRIMRSYYKLLRAFTTEMKDKVWFLEGVSQVLPVNVEEYAGGAGGINMMLDFLGGGPAMVEEDLEDSIVEFDAAGNLNHKLPDMNGMPSEITSEMEVMQGDTGFMNIR